MPTTLNLRAGVNSRTIQYMEGTRGSDAGITAGTVMPLRGDQEPGYELSRAEVELPLGNGTIQGGGSAPQQWVAGGGFPCWLDFLFLGNVLKMPYGTAGYSRTALVSGSVHSFFPTAASVPVPLTCQFQNEFRESTAVYWRSRYNLLRSLGLAYAQGGGAPLDLDFLGVGDAQFTDLAGTKTDNGVQGVSAFNGQARLAAAALVPSWATIVPTDFRVTLDAGVSVVPAAFNDGVAVGGIQGVPTLRGSLALPMIVGGTQAESDFVFSDYARNRTLMAYKCMWADQAVSVSPYPTAWLELKIATLALSYRTPKSGGRNFKSTMLDWFHKLDNTYSKIAATSFGTIVGPYLISSGTTDVFSVKPDGGTTINVTLTAGAARTATQIVGELNADVTFAAKLLAEVVNGRVYVTSKQTGGTGASSSVQFITATANNCSAILGFNGNAIAGFDAPYVWQLRNAMTADY